MKVTIITSVYNMEQYLDRCISSALTQSFKDFELILINDGSTDGSGKICQKWAEIDERIVYISKENEGLGASRNLGIQLAKGEFVAFLDADDWIEKDFLEKMVTASYSYSADVVVSDMCFVNFYGDRVEKKISKIRFMEGVVCTDNELNYFGRCRTFLCGKIINREIFIHNNITLPTHSYEDISVVPYIIYKAVRVAYVEGALYYYFRNRNGSIVNDFSQLQYINVSLAELMNRFSLEEKEEEEQLHNGTVSCAWHRDALRSLFWGQVCNVWKLTKNRFSSEDNKMIDDLRSDILEAYCRYFPEGEYIKKVRIYIDGDRKIYNALMKILLDESQITNSIENAQVVVCDKELFLDDIDKKVIILNDISIDGDIESEEWNVADLLFDRIVRSGTLNK